MRLELLCPACGLQDLDSNEYESMVLLAQNLALTQFTCPGCHRSLSVTMRLTPSLHREATKRLAAQETADSSRADSSRADVSGTDAQPAADAQPDAAPRTAQPAADAPPAASTTTISYTSRLVLDAEPEGFHLVSPLRIGNPEVKAQLEYFRRQLEQVDTVDEAIQEIDSGSCHEKRDS